MLEQLEDRRLMSVSGGLTANDIGPITAFKNTPITIDVLAGDVTTNPGSISVVNVTQGTLGSATVNSDNSVTFTPTTNTLGVDTITITASDGTDTATAAVNFVVTESPSDLYADYQTAVSQADQVYSATAQAAITSYKGTVIASGVATTSAADGLYTDYLSVVNAASQDYQTTHAAIQATYDIAAQRAQSAADASTNAALSAFDTAANGAKNDLDAALQASTTTYQQAQQAADGAYQSAVSPYQAAVNSALANAQANPGDPNAQATLAQAQQDLTSAQSQASAVHDGAYADALAAKQSADAAATQVFQTSVIAASNTALAAAEVAGATYNSTIQAAANTADLAESAAQQTYTAAGQNAWAIYQNALAGLNAQLQTDATNAQTVLTGALSNALATWSGTEATAWGTYTGSLTALSTEFSPGAEQLLPAVNLETSYNTVQPLGEQPQVAPVMLCSFWSGVGTALKWGTPIGLAITAGVYIGSVLNTRTQNNSLGALGQAIVPDIVNAGRQWQPPAGTVVINNAGDTAGVINNVIQSFGVGAPIQTAIAANQTALQGMGATGGFNFVTQATITYAIDGASTAPPGRSGNVNISVTFQIVGAGTNAAGQQVTTTTSVTLGQTISGTFNSSAVASAQVTGQQ